MSGDGAATDGPAGGAEPLDTRPADGSRFQTMFSEPSSSTPGPAVVSLEGEIDLHESPQVLERINPLIASRSPKIHVDMSRVSYIDSSGLAAFIDAMQRIQAYGGEFALVAMRDSVHKIFEISRLDQVFKILPALDGAGSGSP